MSILILLILSLLVAGAGGLHPDIHPACVVAVTLGLVVCRPATNRLSVRFLWVSALALLFWTIITLIPVPAAVAGMLGPQRRLHFEQATQVRRDLQALHPAAPNQVSMPGTSRVTTGELRVPARLTLNSSGTQRFFLLAAGAWGLFWLAASRGSTAKRRLLKIIVAGGTLVVLTSLLFRQACFIWTLPLFPWDQSIAWEKYPGLWPFINTNHFASFAAMLAPAAFCLAVRPRQTRTPGLPVASKFKQDLQAFFAVAERLAWITAFGILATGVFCAGSRGGALALIIATMLVTACWLMVRHKTTATLAAGIGVVTLSALVLAPSAGFQKKMESLHQFSEALAGSRLAIWHSALTQWQAFPIAGGGMESFRVLGNLYKTQPMEESAVYVHCEYLQLLADGGMLCAALFLAMLAAYLWTLLRPPFPDSPLTTHHSPLTRFKCHASPPVRWRFLADPEQRLLKIAALGAVTALFIHIGSDFACRIPLNTCLAAVLLGLGVSVGRESDEIAKPRDRAWHAAIFCGSLLLLGLVLWTANNIGGKNRQCDRPTWNAQATLAELADALKEEPSYWAVWYEMGRKSREIAVGALPVEPEFARRPTVGWLSETAHRLIPAPNSPPLSPPPAPSSKLPAPSTKKAWLAFSGDCFRRAAEYNPKYSQIWSTLAALESEAGHPAAARDAYAKLLELSPERAAEINKRINALTPAATKPAGAHEP